MDLNTAAFAFSILVSAAAAIFSDYRHQKLLASLFRPFTIILMIGLLLEIRPASFYRNTILVSLVFCLFGDTMMMLKKKKFLAGLVFFLAAQVALAVAFFSKLSQGFLTWPVIPLLIFAAVILYLIWPGLGGLKMPVIFYLLAILTMARLALELPHQVPGFQSWLAAAGAVLFLISDAFLAVNRFYRALPQAQLYILSSFYLSLLLITLSV